MFCSGNGKYNIIQVDQSKVEENIFYIWHTEKRAD